MLYRKNFQLEKQYFIQEHHMSIQEFQMKDKIKYQNKRLYQNKNNIFIYNLNYYQINKDQFK